MRKKRPSKNHVEPLELEGPSDPRLTPPPLRRTGLAVVAVLGVLVLALAIGILIVRPEELVTVVQAFVGDF